LDLAAMVAAGYGQHRLPLPISCGECGEVGRLRVRPPVPTCEAGVWMELQ